MGLHIFATTLVCTTVCTLNCKNCLIKIPFQKNKHTDYAVIKKSVEKYFKLVDNVDEFTIMGGEAFLYPQFSKLLLFMDQFSKRIGKLFFITQGSYMPDEMVFSALEQSQCNCFVHVDDYGRLSRCLLEVLKAFEDHHISFDVRHYNEEEQYYGGWVDVVGEFAFQGYEDGGLDVYQRCKNKENCKFIWDGTLYSCGMHAAGVKLGRVPLGEGDAISLLEERNLDHMRDIIARMGTKPVEGCKYCYGWDVKKSPRIKAAIQMEEM